MSYILDALRRADAERERGEVPGLQSQQHALLPDDDVPARSRLLAGAVVVLSLALVGALAWNFFGREATAPRPVSQGTVVAPAAPVPPPPPPAPTVLPSTATPATAPAPAPAAPASAAPAAPTTAARPAPPATRRAATKAAGAASARAADAAESRRDATRATRATPAASTAREGADGRVYAQSELPEPIRRELPKLSVGGASYSNDAASRMLILNGQVFHEGDRIAPGLTLEKIRLRSAVFSFKGYRYELNY